MSIFFNGRSGKDTDMDLRLWFYVEMSEWLEYAVINLALIAF